MAQKLTPTVVCCKKTHTHCQTGQLSCLVQEGLHQPSNENTPSALGVAK